jgi:hypothetical protein
MRPKTGDGVEFSSIEPHQESCISTHQNVASVLSQQRRPRISPPPPAKCLTVCLDEFLFCYFFFISGFINQIQHRYLHKCRWMKRSREFILVDYSSPEEEDDDDFEITVSRWARTRCTHDTKIPRSASRTKRSILRRKMVLLSITDAPKHIIVVFWSFEQFMHSRYLNPFISLASNNLVCKLKFYSFAILVFYLFDRFACVWLQKVLFEKKIRELSLGVRLGSIFL